MTGSLRRRYSDVAWGITECSRTGCFEEAILWVDEVWGQLCARCADELLDRANAIGQYPAVRELLPAWDDQ